MYIPPTHANAVRLYGPEFTTGPAELYRRIQREHGPVAPALTVGDVPVWLVLGYREVHHVLDSPQLFSRNSQHWNLWDEIPPDWPLRPLLAWTPSVLFAEGGEHRRRSGAISDALEGTSHTDLARICERTADQLIDAFAGDGRADLIAQYAEQVPIRVVARLCGLPEPEVPGMADDIILTVLSGPEALAASERILGRLGQVIAAHRDQARYGLTARLVAHPARLSDAELMMDLFLLMMGGQQVTADWIGNTLRLMLLDDEFSLALQGGRRSVTHALNEVLWKDTPLQQQMGRWALQRCDFGGQVIGKGDMLVLGLASANADPQVQPTEFDNTANNRAHMSFAHGEHSCPAGAPETAEAMARIAVEVLLDRIPDARLAVPAEEIRWKETAIVRGLQSLPVAFTPVYAGARR